MLESWLFQFFLKGNWQINTTLFSQYIKPVNQRTIFSSLSNLNFLRWESGAKVRQIFQTTKFLEDFFLKNFSKNLLYRLASLRGESGCKGKTNFSNHQIFDDFFFITFLKNLCAFKSYAVFLDCGCKGSTYFLISKHFWNFFYYYFYPYLTHCCISTLYV